jgi:hypothetical protein
MTASDDAEKVGAVIDHMVDVLDRLDKTLTRYAKEGANTAPPRSVD